MVICIFTTLNSFLARPCSEYGSSCSDWLQDPDLFYCPVHSLICCAHCVQGFHICVDRVSPASNVIRRMFDILLFFFCACNWVTSFISVWEKCFAPARESGYKASPTLNSRKLKKIGLICKIFKLCIIYVLCIIWTYDLTCPDPECHPRPLRGFDDDTLAGHTMKAK